MKSLPWMMILLLFVGSIWTGCATTSGLPEVEPMPEGKGFSGLWYSPQFQHMYLSQEGEAVFGVYAYQGGGTLEGEVRGNQMIFTWSDPGNREEMRRAMRGKGYFRLVEEEGTIQLVGEWGYNEEYRGAGPWTADFVRPLEEEDPRTVEEIRRVH